MNNARKQRQLARKQLAAKTAEMTQQIVNAVTNPICHPAIFYAARTVVFERWVKERATRRV